jgi:hypothetical protein
MMALMTLCEAYMGIEPHFKPWNYFFHICLQQVSGAKVAALGSVDIFIRSVHGVDPYFHLLTSSSPDEWQKGWFFLKNDTDAPLPMFTGSRPIPQPNWGYNVAQKDLRRLQLLQEVVQKLLQGGLTGVEILWTFFSHREQPLR